MSIILMIVVNLTKRLCQLLSRQKIMFNVSVCFNTIMRISSHFLMSN